MAHCVAQWAPIVCASPGRAGRNEPHIIRPARAPLADMRQNNGQCGRLTVTRRRPVARCGSTRRGSWARLAAGSGPLGLGVCGLAGGESSFASHTHPGEIEPHQVTSLIVWLAGRRRLACTLHLWPDAAHQSCNWPFRHSSRRAANQPGASESERERRSALI